MSAVTRNPPLLQLSPEDLAHAGEEFVARAFAAAASLVLTPEAAAAFADGPEASGGEVCEDENDPPDL